MPNGQIDFAETMKILDEVDLISFASVNNVVGFKQDLRLFRPAKKKNMPQSFNSYRSRSSLGKNKNESS